MWNNMNAAAQTQEERHYLFHLHVETKKKRKIQYIKTESRIVIARCRVNGKI
jgi:hypothetical protein